MPTAKVQTGLRIEEELYKKLCILAKSEGRSLNNLCEYILRMYVEKEEAKFGTIDVSED